MVVSFASLQPKKADSSSSKAVELLVAVSWCTRSIGKLVPIIVWRSTVDSTALELLKLIAKPGTTVHFAGFVYKTFKNKGYLHSTTRFSVEGQYRGRKMWVGGKSSHGALGARGVRAAANARLPALATASMKSRASIEGSALQHVSSPNIGMGARGASPQHGSATAGQTPSGYVASPAVPPGRGTDGSETTTSALESALPEQHDPACIRVWAVCRAQGEAIDSLTLCRPLAGCASVRVPITMLDESAGRGTSGPVGAERAQAGRTWTEAGALRASSAGTPGSAGTRSRAALAATDSDGVGCDDCLPAVLVRWSLLPRPSHRFGGKVRDVRLF